MANPVQDDLGDSARAILVLVPGFVINSAREAVQRLRAGCRIPLEDECRRRRVGARSKRNLRVDLERLIRRDRPNDHRRRGRGRGTGAIGRGRRYERRRNRRGGDQGEQAEAQCLTRVGSPQRSRALPCARRLAAKPVERARKGHRLSHSVGDIAS